MFASLSELSSGGELEENMSRPDSCIQDFFTSSRAQPAGCFGRPTNQMRNPVICKGHSLRVGRIID